MTKVSSKGTKLTSESIRKEMKKFFKNAMELKLIDAVMMPMQVPSKDSYTWILIKDIDYLEDMNPLAPIMPINAANALKRYTRKGKGKFKIAVLMRPCEIRATIELTKLKQIELEDVILFSYDCIGALPMQDYIADPENNEKKFDKILEEDNWNSKDLKPVCNICDKFSLSASDVHFGLKDNEIIILSNSEKGEKLLSENKIEDKKDDKIWAEKINKIKIEKSKSRQKSFKEIKIMTDGFTNLQDTFAHCIGCHNCGTVCPICYCRQCYFDSSVSKPNSDVKLIRAENKGALAFPLDRLMFHIGRMSHMSLSCVSCGLCSDACPVDIPVANIFSYMANETQKTFEYSAGESVGDALPMRDYKLDELGELGKLVKSAEAGENENE
ncbi:MAG: 4Fe-4S binding protein [Armatimonadetes bacterium]|nr:4Fe-4S binding protein [Armatimonadota bacterium]